MEEMWRGLEESAMARWEGVVGAELARQMQAVVAQERAMMGKEQRLASKEKRSSFFGTLGTQKASSANLTRSPPVLALSSLPNFLHSSSASLPPFLLHLADSQQGLATTALRHEVEEIDKRRKVTSQKYEGRLELLRARLRGAVLREGLRGS